MEAITCIPIGVVRNAFPGPERPQQWRTLISEIPIKPELAELLDGLEEFSHIVILFYMHRIPPGQFPARVHPRGREDLPLVGVFASRHYSRPNSIGLTIVRLLERRGTVLRVQGLDAFDGTPVLDIKPFTSLFDQPPPEEVRVPQWVHQLHDLPY